MPRPETVIDSFFVYGTLQRGQCRESVWPADPLQVVPGWIHGTLFGRDDYPALMKGENRVRGQLWVFEPQRIERVRAVLDEVEGTHGNGPTDLYHRHFVDVHFDDGRTIRRAYTYFYNRDPLLDGFSQIQVSSGSQAWPS